MTAALTIADIDALTGGRLGQHDIACPYCGPERRSTLNQRRKVLRVWRAEPAFATFCCARCGEHGYCVDRPATGLPRAPASDDVPGRAAARAAMQAAQRVATRKRLSLARYLWARREHAQGTIVERYLRVRGYSGRIPDTLAFLPPVGEHAPAMIAAFGFAEEPEPGAVSMPEHVLAGVHLTKLAPNGSGKAGSEKDKLMIGYSKGAPIVLAPLNDLLGLAIVEGIEKGLAVREALGLGVWVAGAAARLPALADCVPSYTDCVTIFVDDDKDGRRHAATLAHALERRSIHVEPIVV